MTDSWAAWSREAVALANARNEGWVARFGLHGADYHWDLHAATLTLHRPGVTVAADLCFVGSISASEGTFLWGWANESIPQSARRRLDEVRAFGERYGLDRLIASEWPGTDADALEMMAVASRILDAEGTWIDRSADLTMVFALFNLRRTPTG